QVAQRDVLTRGRRPTPGSPRRGTAHFPPGRGKGDRKHTPMWASFPDVTTASSSRLHPPLSFPPYSVGSTSSAVESAAAVRVPWPLRAVTGSVRGRPPGRPRGLPMSRREFRLSEGASHKFWAITVADTRHTIEFGRLGSAGQTQVKQFPTPEAAQAA